ncbi:MAG: RluA family pseudouridine synthase [Bacteroidia bacterium]|nr:RluA family pseudouridine synthase [Bacteroidia bacterium]
MSKPANIKDWIIFENDDFAVVNKPAFVPSISERGKFTHTPLLDMAKKEWDDAILCHRLDRETSGAIIVAKNPEAYRHASIQFEKRLVEKTYHAIVDGQVRFENLKVDLSINTDNLANIHIDRKTGKKALTWFNSIAFFKHFTLMECKPVTGRLHQIRVHLASQNARIAGDLMYGSEVPMLSSIKRKMSGEDTALIQRFALHARSIRFKAMDNSELHIEAPYPKDFEVFLKLLNKYDV